MVADLETAGRMTPAGRAAFEGRKAGDPAGYSYERRSATFDERSLRQFRRRRRAWLFFQAQPPGYRRVITLWVMSAKQEITRERRVAKLIEACEAAKRLQ